MERSKCYHRKLVRDRIPEIIKNNGGEFEVRKLDQKEFDLELRRKLIEESHEVDRANKEDVLDELADVLEVLINITETSGYSREELEQKMVTKREKRGGFDKRLFLEWSTSDSR